MKDFPIWSAQKSLVAIQTQCVYPIEAKLRYPAHKRKGREIIAQMPTAEANLDKFWAAIDDSLENKTGSNWHKTVQNYIDEGGPLIRNPSWKEPIKNGVPPLPQLDLEYQPVSDATHDKSVEFTGSFDRMQVTAKTKHKTRGMASRAQEANGEADVDAEAQLLERVLNSATVKPFTVDPRTKKVFRTLLPMPSTDAGGLPKVVKWAEFKRAMGRIGFSVEKLQGSAW